MISISRFSLITAVAIFFVEALLPADADFDVAAHYSKREVYIPMRDGTRLFTILYSPRNRAVSYPILLTRTPYGVAPYKEGEFPSQLGPSSEFDRDGFIFAFQDVRGRYLSEGRWVEMRPLRNEYSSPADTDESTDAYDTVDWLVKNTPGNNGKVGLIGISYPGTYAAEGMIGAHPAVKAVSPQAPVADLYLGDDAYHNGAFLLLGNYDFYSHFVRQSKPGIPVQKRGPELRDAYRRFLHAFPAVDLLRNDADWRDMLSHTAYDSYWRARDLLPHLRNIRPAVLVAGGWFDAEDLSGTLKTYRAIREQSPETTVYLAMGPWKHGGWEEDRGDKLGDVQFGSDTSSFFQSQIALAFFRQYLKDAPDAQLPAAYMFETGVNTWKRIDAWPPREASPRRFYLQAGGVLAESVPEDAGGYDEYVSDPRRPVPAFEKPTGSPDPGYMDADQRFLEHRHDVMRYVTPALREDLQAAGPIKVVLHVSSSGTDSDFVVKVIDGYPAPERALSGYEQLVRAEPFRAKFREGFEQPKPLTPGRPESIEFTMPDVDHRFLKGHRLMVEVQSSWFPLIDLNPQQFVDIPNAGSKKYRPATERIYRSRQAPSYVEFLAAR